MFPDYTAGQHGGTLQPPQRKSLVNIKSLATQAAVENTELADLPQRASDVNTAVNQLFTETGTNTDGLPLRDLLALDDALQRHRGALVDNLAKLQQLDTYTTIQQLGWRGPQPTATPCAHSSAVFGKQLRGYSMKTHH